ncbi:MAG: sensor histidine kinase [Desulfobacter sp.]|nr:MAG: sensor histidine kinase [Desulfobacter sp.]
MSRILGNMVINALEATPENGEIKIELEAGVNGQMIWRVWNQSPIPKPIQKRIFQRYFSSKEGNGRGLGTYSMKLFGESYLKAVVSG